MQTQRGFQSGTIIVLVLLFLSPVFSGPLHLDLVTGGVGSWVALEQYQTLFFHKLVFSGYYSAGRLRGYLSLPVLWSIQSVDQTKEHAIALTDIFWYQGVALGFFEPRLGIVVPPGYAIDGPWLGSRNVKLYAGTGLNSSVFEEDRLHISGEIGWYLYVSEQRALARRWSWELIPQWKISARPSRFLKLGGELFGTLSRVTWGESFDEVTLTLVPHLFAEFYFTKKVFAGLKTGYGPTFKATTFNDLFSGAETRSRSGSLNLGISLNLYP